MKICIILGTRPEIIKMSPVIRACEKNKLDYFILHTGQHYFYNMDKSFFEELELPQSKYNLKVGSGNHGEQTAKILRRTEKVLLKENPNVVLVEGDTNTVLASALAASKLNIKVGHIEAGLRSYDRTMPEETNRLLTDHISDLLFCPTELSKANALKEGIDKRNLFVTGNTIVDAVMQNKEIAMKKSNILEKLNLKKQKFFLVTAHRTENVDIKEKLNNIISALDNINKKYGMPVIYPIHPRTRKMIDKFNIDIPESINLIPPVNFLDFLQLEANAKLILTDSGGVQEESCILGVPCVTLRENTERPETLDVKSNMLAGTEPKKTMQCVEAMLNAKKGWQNPFGDGKASERIVNIIKNRFQ
jgi:UDP-N-acetylglucosamine 2-epimerase (non-hydrolysing)